jgi:hypothetical protein
MNANKNPKENFLDLISENLRNSRIIREEPRMARMIANKKENTMDLLLENLWTWQLKY